MMKFNNGLEKMRLIQSSHLLWFVALLISISVQAQVPVVTRTECVCLNNQTQQGNGQFAEQIVIRAAAGQTWTVESATGLFSAASPAPPAAPIPIVTGTVLVENPAGTYTLNARRIDNTFWNVVLTNGTNRFPLNSTHGCRYPNRDIIGDFGGCINSPDKKYSLDIKNSMLHSLQWTVSAGVIVGSSGANPVTVNWPNAVGNYTITVNGVARSYPGQTTVAHMCSFADTATVAVVNETPVALACNDLVTINMNQRCEMNITPDMILEDPKLPESSYDVVLRDIQADTIIKNGRIRQAYLNKLIEVKVIQECGGNSCWGLVKFEDKSIPALTCTPDVTINCNQLTSPSITGFPLRPDAVVTPIPGSPTKFLVKNHDYCSDVILEYRDELDQTDCTGPYSSVVKRTWIAIDGSNNITQCSSRIFILKASASTITFPGNYDDVLGPNPSLDACGNWPRLINGHPDPSFTGSPSGVFCRNVTVDYTDTRLQKCRGSKSFKIIRRWLVTDVCTGEQIIRNQTITVVDKTAPVVMTPPNITVGTTGLTCAGSVTVLKPRISDCSGTDYAIRYRIAGPDGLPTGDEIGTGITRGTDSLYTISNIPTGTTKIFVIYYVFDDCDNTTSVTSMVELKDLTPPVPVCDEFTFVGLNDDGVGFVTTESLDDGSWDNCGIAKMEATRMEASSCGITNTWGPKIKFCCEDVNKEFMVQLRVIDAAGNSNTCMVKVRVQDNVPPELKNCPRNITVDCNADLLGLAQYGVPTVTDLCGATLKEDVRDNGFDDCGRGSITRTFTATDAQGNKTTCQQTITVRPSNLFKASDIRWPQDHEFTNNGCLSQGVKPEELPAGRQRPIFTQKPCSQVSVEYDDIVFQYVEGFCFKILRKWTVIDFCQFDPTNPNNGKFTYTQVIKGKNAIAPNITKGCSPTDVKITQTDNCKALLEATAAGSDDCTAPERLVWSYTLDVDNNGTIDFTGNNNVISRQVNFGNSKITWTVTDECGNTKSCMTTVEVKDTKKPTPYCYSELVTVLMSTTGSVEIWAKDYDRGSFDNCSATSTLRFSFSTNPADAAKTFTCADMTDKITFKDLRIYVFDNAGNSDFCTVKIKLQDNNNRCGFGFAEGGNNNGTSSKISITGQIKSENEIPIQNVDIKLFSNQAEYPKFVNSNEKGEFIFPEVTSENDYMISPSKTGNYLDGVTTLDLVLIQRHILGLKKFDSPYKIIAADANNDEKITTTDLVVLRKLILGITDVLSNTNSWKFVDKAQVFPDINKPFPYKSNIQMEKLNHNVGNGDFIAVKVGDVNTSYTNLKSEIAENRNIVKINYSTTSVMKGQEIEIPFDLEDKKVISGLQLSLNYDDKKFDVVGVKQADLKIDENNLSVIEDKINLSYVSQGTDEIKTGQLFKLILKAKTDIESGEFITINRNGLKSEIYSLNGNGITTENIMVELRGKVGEQFELFQNTPNPFNQNTIIGFNLPEAGEVNFKVYDTSGKILKEMRKYFDKGYNTIDLNVAELNTTGILIYQLDSKTQSANKKMVVIK